MNWRIRSSMVGIQISVRSLCSLNMNLSFIVIVQISLQPASVESDPIAVPEIPVEDSFFDDFRTAFTEQLSQLTSSVSDAATVLPERSQPNGNGVAYARFVEVLDGLYAAENDTTPDEVLAEVFA
jgi:hypothetical protein